MESVAKFIAGLKQEEVQIFRNMAVFPLVGSEDVKTDYLTLEQGLQARTVEITEIGDAGVVPELVLANRADKPLLIIDGEEMVGAKQNRIINVTLLVAARAVVKIPVSCVEQGRWEYKTSNFEDGKRIFSSRGRACKMAGVTESLRQKVGFVSDQGAVWEEVNALSCDLDVESETKAFADAYKQVDTRLKDYQEKIRMVENQVGMLIFIDGKIAGLDVLGKSATLEVFFNKLISSYAIDALRTVRAEKKYRKPNKKAATFLEELKSAKLEFSDSISLGHDVRLESKSALGAALEHNGEVFHLCAFAKQSEGADREGSGFASYSHRSRRFDR